MKSMPVVCVDTNVWFYTLARPAQGEMQKHLYVEYRKSVYAYLNQ